MLTLLAACAAVSSASAQERGRLVGAQAGGDAFASSVELISDRPLSFTTLKLRAPPRVVVDFADTELSGIPRELSVGDGTIRRVAAAPAGQHTARVVIELAEEAEFDVHARGNRVQVRVPRVAPLVAAAERPHGGTAAPRQREAVVLATPPAPAAVEQRAPLAAARAPAPAPAAAAPAPAETAPAPAAAPAKVAAARPAPAAAAPAPAPAGSGQAAAPAAPAAPAPSAPVAPAPSAPVAPAPPALTAAPPAPVAIPSAPVAIPAAPVATPAAQPRPAPVPVAAPKPPAERKVALAAPPRHAITGIGFRPIEGGEVIVRSDHPLEYGVTGDGSALLLHLPSAAIPLPNNRRALDTRFFNGPVQRVVPVVVQGGTDLRIELRGRAEYQLAQSGGILTVTFSAPR